MGYHPLEKVFPALGSAHQTRGYLGHLSDFAAKAYDLFICASRARDAYHPFTGRGVEEG